MVLRGRYRSVNDGKLAPGKNKPKLNFEVGCSPYWITLPFAMPCYSGKTNGSRTDTAKKGKKLTMCPTPKKRVQEPKPDGKADNVPGECNISEQNGQRDVNLVIKGKKTGKKYIKIALYVCIFG